MATRALMRLLYSWGSTNGFLTSCGLYPKVKIETKYPDYMYTCTCTRTSCVCTCIHVFATKAELTCSLLSLPSARTGVKLLTQ